MTAKKYLSPLFFLSEKYIFRVIFIYLLLTLMTNYRNVNAQEKSIIESLPIVDEYHSDMFELRQLLSLPEDNIASDWHCFSLSHDGKLVAIGNKNNGLFIVDRDRLNGIVRVFNHEQVQSVEFLPSNPSFLLCGTNKALHILKAPEYEVQHSLRECYSDNGVAWIFMPLSNSNSIFGISPSSPMVRTAKKHEWCYSLSKDMKSIKSVEFIGKKDAKIIYWVFSISPNGKWLAVSAGLREPYGISVFKLEVNDFPDTIPHTSMIDLVGNSQKDGMVYVAGFSPDGSLCLGGGNATNNVITVWNVQSNEVVDEIPVPKRKGGTGLTSFAKEMIYGLDFSNDGKLMAATWANYVGIWELRKHKLKLGTVTNGTSVSRKP